MTPSKDKSIYNRNCAVRIIYEGLNWVVSTIDWLEFDYMIEWRNQMMSWRGDLELRYKWLKHN